MRLFPWIVTLLRFALNLNASAIIFVTPVPITTVVKAVGIPGAIVPVLPPNATVPILVTLLGIVTVSSNLWALKALLPIVTNVLGKLMLSRDVLLWKAVFCIAVMPSGMTRFTIPVLENAPIGISVNPVPKVIDVRFVVPENAFDPRLVKLLGNVILVKALPVKAVAPIVVKPSGKVILVTKAFSKDR